MRVKYNVFFAGRGNAIANTVACSTSVAASHSTLRYADMSMGVMFIAHA
ncbi:hypothetical protein [Paraburkholderia sp. J63]|nr:hypothetical protein [Paraburkholderia sp. J63]